MIITEQVRKLRAVAFALNKVEVKGQENMDALLGSIQTVEAVANQLECYQATESKSAEESDITIEATPE